MGVVDKKHEQCREKYPKMESEIVFLFHGDLLCFAVKEK
jgi:hypothetical protein